MALPDLTELNVSDTYKGVLHTSNVIFTESNLPPIYDGLGNKSSLKLGADGNGASVSGCLSADCLTITGYPSIIDYLYPVGAVYLDTLDVNPQTRFVGTSWIKIANGRFIAGVGTGTDINGVTKVFTSGDNNTTYQNIIPTIPHIHGIGRFESNDDPIFPLQDWNDGTTYTMGRSTGEDPYKEFYGQTGSPRGIVSSLPLTNEDTTVGNTPPGFGLYIWQRIL